MRRSSLSAPASALLALVLLAAASRARATPPPTDERETDIRWLPFTLAGAGGGAATGVSIFALGASGLLPIDPDAESFLLLTGISAGLGLAIGALLAPAFPRRTPAEDGTSRAPPGRTRAASFALHLGKTRFTGPGDVFTDKDAFDARLFYPLNPFPYGSIGMSCTYTTFERPSSFTPHPRDEVIVIGPDARIGDFDGVLAPYGSLGLKYITSETSSGSGERQRTLGAQLSAGLRIRPKHARIFAELEGRYVQSFVKLAGSTQYQMTALTAGLGLLW